VIRWLRSVKNVAVVLQDAGSVLIERAEADAAFGIAKANPVGHEKVLEGELGNVLRSRPGS
jgi:hypothetical protein